jgi:hypothetical protein
MAREKRPLEDSTKDSMPEEKRQRPALAKYLFFSLAICHNARSIFLVLSRLGAAVAASLQLKTHITASCNWSVNMDSAIIHTGLNFLFFLSALLRHRAEWSR